MIRSIFEKVLLCLFILLLTGVVAVFAVYFTVKDDIPQLPEKLSNINLSLPTEIYSSDGRLIKSLGERHPVGFDEISPNFTQAITAAEDSRFYRHHGIDHFGLLRAVYKNFKEKRIVQGGSTITQQLSKNLFFSFEKNWMRKIKELLVALQIEASFSKREILEAYCNQIYFGSGAYGVEEASQVYFGKRAKELTLLQASTLAGIPHSPNEINPYSNFERSQQRAKYILERMTAEKTISQEERDEALKSDLALIDPKEETDPNLYFVDYVVDRLEKDYGKEFVYFGGLKVFTTIDARMQEFAQKAVQNHLQFLEDKMIQKESARDVLQSAAVSIDNKTGAVRVMLGGRNYSRSQFNRAVSNNRLPGSSFKPFVYMSALEFLGYTPATVVTDELVTFNIPGTAPWEPKNFEEHYYGSLVLKKALMKSINVVSAKMVAQLTPQTVINVARQFGITSPLGNHYSLALGTSPVSPLEMASAYSVIADQGMLYEPYFIQRVEDFQGNRLYEHFHRGIRRFPQKTIYPLLDMMRGVVEDGTGRIVRKMGFDHPAAGKTGTTNDSKDAWFIGFTKDITTSVWVGKDNNEPVLDRNKKGMTGSEAAAPIWVFLMQKALEGKTKVQFPVPEGIRFVDVDVRTGQPPEFSSYETVRVALEENSGRVASFTESKEEVSGKATETSSLQATGQH